MSGDTRIWTMDLSDCSRLLYHWAISPAVTVKPTSVRQWREMYSCVLCTLQVSLTACSFILETTVEQQWPESAEMRHETQCTVLQASALMSQWRESWAEHVFSSSSVLSVSCSWEWMSGWWGSAAGAWHQLSTSGYQCQCKNIIFHLSTKVTPQNMSEEMQDWVCKIMFTCDSWEGNY